MAGESDARPRRIALVGVCVERGFAFDVEARRSDHDRMDGPVCCAVCFADEYLRHEVRDVSSEKGDCDYCERENVDVLPVGALYGSFKNLLRLYMRSDSPHGDALIDLIQWDYEVFDDDLYTSGEADRLLEDIMDAGWDDDDGEPRVDARELYYRASSTTMSEAWRDFCTEVQANPAHDLPDALRADGMFDEDIGRIAVEVSAGTVLHRAQIGFVEDKGGKPQPYEGERIGAPPPEKAKASRANAGGEVVLYVADQESTAIAEVRPSRGLLVSVAGLRTQRDLQVVDLSKPLLQSNPFTDEAPQYWLEFGELLDSFGEELGRPLRRNDNPNDYIPSQRLVRRIGESGFYDGIRYPPSVPTRVRQRGGDSLL